MSIPIYIYTYSIAGWPVLIKFLENPLTKFDLDNPLTKFDLDNPLNKLQNEKNSKSPLKKTKLGLSYSLVLRTIVLQSNLINLIIHNFFIYLLSNVQKWWNLIGNVSCKFLDR